MNLLESLYKILSPIIYLKYRYKIEGKYYKGLDKIVSAFLIKNPDIIFGSINDCIILLFGKYELTYNIKKAMYTIYEIENNLETISNWENSKGYKVEYTAEDHRIYRNERPSLYNLNKIVKMLNIYYKGLHKQMYELEKESNNDRVLEDEKFARNIYIR